MTKTICFLLDRNKYKPRVEQSIIDIPNQYIKCEVLDGDIEDIEREYEKKATKILYMIPLRFDEKVDAETIRFLKEAFLGGVQATVFGCTG